MNENRFRIRVANVIEDGRLSGPQRRMIQVTKNMKQKIIQTIIVIPRRESLPFRQYLESFDSPYILLPLQRLAKGPADMVRYLFGFPFEVALLAYTFRRHHFDIIHISGGAWQVKAFIAAKVIGKKVIWHLNDTYMPEIIYTIFRYLLPLSDAFIVAGQRVSDYYLKSYRNRKSIFEIPAPVDTNIFDPTKTMPDPDLGQDTVNIITVCTLTPGKDLESFLHMAHRLSQQYNYLRFFIIGPHLPSQRSYILMLKKLVREYKIENVIFYGPSERIHSLLAASHIYVCSSLAEASPTSVWEAMSMKLPVVSTDVGDVSKYIRDGANGFIVPIRDVDALVDRVSQLIENSKMRIDFGRRARNEICKQLDISIVVEKHVHAYLSLMNGKA